LIYKQIKSFSIFYLEKKGLLPLANVALPFALALMIPMKNRVGATAAVRFIEQELATIGP